MNPALESERVISQREIAIDAGRAVLNGSLRLPENPIGIVLFAHGSGSSRFSPRNRFVAEMLLGRNIATSLFDLLTRDEESVDQRTAKLRFDIDLLAKRLIAATRWVMSNPDTSTLKIGFFGASTGAAAALVAAAQLRATVAAVVSRGGRPDLAGDSLAFVRAPTLLIVGGRDEVVIEMNRQAMAKMLCAPKELVVIPGATHLFEEPGTLEEVARMAAQWFSDHFSGAAKAHSERLQPSEWPPRGGFYGE